MWTIWTTRALGGRNCGGLRATVACSWRRVGATAARRPPHLRSKTQTRWQTPSEWHLSTSTPTRKNPSKGQGNVHPLHSTTRRRDPCHAPPPIVSLRPPAKSEGCKDALETAHRSRCNRHIPSTSILRNYSRSITYIYGRRPHLYRGGGIAPPGAAEASGPTRCPRNVKTTKFKLGGDRHLEIQSEHPRKGNKDLQAQLQCEVIIFISKRFANAKMTRPSCRTAITLL